AYDLALERYDRGLTDSLNVIDAQRLLYDLERQHILAREAAAHSLIALYKALGGGWRPFETLPPIRTPQPAVVAAINRVLHPDGGP
ncbi:TolC family protein, partial [Acinetobacter baumannii]